MNVSDKKLEAARAAIVQLGMTDEKLPSEGGKAPYGGAPIGSTAAEISGTANHAVHQGHLNAANAAFGSAMQLHHAGKYKESQAMAKQAGQHLTDAAKIHATLPPHLQGPSTPPMGQSEKDWRMLPPTMQGSGEQRPAGWDKKDYSDYG